MQVARHDVHVRFQRLKIVPQTIQILPQPLLRSTARIKTLRLGLFDGAKLLGELTHLSFETLLQLVDVVGFAAKLSHFALEQLQVPNLGVDLLQLQRRVPRLLRRVRGPGHSVLGQLTVPFGPGLQRLEALLKPLHSSQFVRGRVSGRR